MREIGMIRAFAFRALTGAGLLLLAACAPTRDPGQAGFFSGIANMMTGAYETDTEALRAEAEASEQRVADLRAENDRLAREAAELDAEERALRERQRVLNERLIDQERALQQLRERRGADQAELDRVSARLQELEAEHQRLAAGQVEPAELQRLEQENQKLEQTLDQMLKSLPG
jgi:DNA repair exonuclease SbcCD ATPase subunit